MAPDSMGLAAQVFSEDAPLSLTEERHQTEISTDPGFELVTVLIPVLNAAKTLPMQLEALTAQTYGGPWEVVVVDNGSSDGSDEIAQGWSDRLPDLRVVYALDRKGCSHARNVGARAARGDFLATCDADDAVEPRWLEAMAEAGRTYDIVGGRLEWISLNSALTRSWRPPPAEDGLPVSLGFLPYAVGANCGVRTEVFQALGGWNEDFPICGDDIDFAWRAQLASYRLGYAPDAVVRYRFREDPHETARQFFHYGRVQPRRYRDYRDQGMPRSSWKRACREWVSLVVHVGDLIGSSQRKGIWMRKVAYRWGRLLGSFRERVLFL